MKLDSKVIRACFDIGSGSTKLMIIINNKNSKLIEKNIYQSLKEVHYGQNWKINGNLTEQI